MKIAKIPTSILLVLHTSDLDVLLIERADKAGFWQSVTGSLDSMDERPLHAAQRELEEETGLRYTLSDFVDWQHQIVYEIYPHWRHRYAEGVTQNVEHWFSLTIPRDAKIQLSPKEHTDYQWLPWQKAAERCFSPSNREAILALPQRLAQK